MADRVDRFGPGAAAPARPGRPPSRCAPSSSARCARRSAPGGCRPASGCRPRASWPAALGVSRGLVRDCYAQLHAEGYLVAPGRLGHPGRRPAAPAGRAGRRRRPPRAPRARPSTSGRRPRPGELPARRLGVGASREACRDGAHRGARLRRPARRRGAARRPRRLPAAGSAAPPPTRTGSSSAPASRRGSASRCARWRERGVRPGRRSRTPVRRDRRRSPAALAGIEVVPVPVDEHGVDVDALAATGPGPSCSRRRTSGRPASCWRPQRRHALVAWARRRGRAGHRGRLRRRVPLRPRAGRRAAGPRPGPGRRCSARSASRSRRRCGSAGWSCPADLPTPVARREAAADRGSPALDQLALATLIESGRYDRHLRRMRASTPAGATPWSTRCRARARRPG